MNLYDLIQAVEHNEATQSLQLCWNTQKSFFFIFQLKFFEMTRKHKTQTFRHFARWYASAS